MDEIKIVASGPNEPDEDELIRKQAEILEKLRGITPDQLAEFRGRSLEGEGAGNITIFGWTKTIWSK